MKNNLMLWIGAVIVVIFLIFVWHSAGKGANTGPGPLDSFATCLKDKGVIFYGAFWCNHCANQKKLFGSSAQLLPYVECSTPDSQGQLSVCKSAKVTNYPTWDFPSFATATEGKPASTTRLTGEIALDVLAQKSGCLLPAETK